MIAEIIQELSTELVTINASWLSEIRAVGYMVSGEAGKIVEIDGLESGVTDRSGNSGYIRHMEGANFSVEQIPTFNSCVSASRYTFRMRLVVVAKTSTPENVAVLLSTQLNNFEYSADKSVKVRVSQGGSNSYSVVQNEGGEQINNEYRAIYLDFTIAFDWRKDCDQISVTMNCTNCTTVYELGCKQHCESIELPVDSEYTGTATLNTNFNGVMVSQSFEVTTGEPITVPMAGLNEDYEYNIQLRNEEGEVITLSIGSPSVDYDCFSVKLMP